MLFPGPNAAACSPWTSVLLMPTRRGTWASTDGPQMASILWPSCRAQLPLAEASVGVIRAVDFLEHVADKIGLFNELYRLLAPGGLLLSQTPSTDGRGAFQDPTHVAFYNENSFWYYTETNYRNFVPEIQVRFQVSRLATSFPSEWHAAHDISYVTANLIAVKEPMDRNGGLLL